MRGGAELRRAALVAAALGCGAGAYWSGRYAYAEVLFGRWTRASVEGAAALAPGNAEYQEGRAALAEPGGPNPAADAALGEALRASPFNSEVLIALGLRAEMRGDFAGAERRLLEAAERNRGYQPRWTLANYYLRRGDGEKFWKWGYGAAQMAYEPTALFRLFWAYTDDGREIVARGIPEEPEILRRYVWFVLGRPEWEPAGAAVDRLLPRAGAEDARALIAYCDRLLWAGRGAEALAVWNALARRKLTGYAELNAERGPWVTNGGFEAPPGNQGFDWRMARVEGVSPSHGAAGLRFSFSGSEPERCELLSQFVMWKAGARYRLGFEYMTSGIAEGSGLRWQVADAAGQQVIAESEDLAGEEWKEAWVRFTAPEGAGLGRVALRYRRATGTTRIEGSLRVRNVRLEIEQ